MERKGKEIKEDYMKVIMKGLPKEDSLTILNLHCTSKGEHMVNLCTDFLDSTQHMGVNLKKNTTVMVHQQRFIIFKRTKKLSYYRHQNKVHILLDDYTSVKK